jgi:GGDEF domain-containing protein
VEPNELTCEKTQSVTQAHIIEEKIRAALTGSYPIIIRYEKTEDTIDEYNCEISMGIVVFVNDNKNRDDVLEWAERSMHKAKKSESSQICFNDTYI